MSQGPPPVPGGRTPEEREAARRERAARREAIRAAPAPAAPPADDPPEHWIDDVEPLPGTPAADGSGGPPRRRPRWGRILVAALLAAGLVAGAWFALSLFQPFHGEGGVDVRVEITQGATLGDIAQQLEREGVISSARFFELRARLAGRTGDLKPGRYVLAEDMSYVAALDALERGVPPDVVSVTIPEGRSRREVAPLVRRLRGDYVRQTRRSPALDPRDYGAEGATSLEGFLFPASYELKKGQPVSALIEKQLGAFRRTFDRVDLSYARARNLTPSEVLTIASLVEREAALPRERPLIASVIYNRLRRGIRLDIDATARFVAGNWTEPLKVSELQNPSPYNTRVHPGLPPGPIGSPGLGSIEAAARPARTDYLFYVAEICGEGRHRFAATNAEFERYVAEYEAERQRRGGKAPTNC